MTRSMPNMLKNALLVVVSTLVTLAVLEGAMRLFEDKLDFPFELYASNIDLFRSAYPAQYDSQLGWIPAPGTSGKNNIWKTSVTIGEGGIRSNGVGPTVRDRPLILVVGDSFAFGDQVSDQETFSAYLEAMAGSRVLNAGVFGYGLDQSYLRALQLIEKYSPDIVVLSLVSEDIERCGLSIRTGVAKPYFYPDPEGRSVQLRNAPVPPPSVGRRFLRNLLSHSYFCSYVMVKLFPDFWMSGTFAGSSTVHTRVFEVTTHILQGLDEIAIRKKIHVLVLLQNFATEMEQDVVGPALASLIGRYRLMHLDLLNTHPVLSDLRRNDPGEFSVLFFLTGGHMTARGNALIANLLYRKMVGSHWL